MSNVPIEPATKLSPGVGTGGIPPGLRPVRVLNRDSIVAEVVQQLLDYFVSSALEPGARLPSERQLSEALGLGRSTVREATKALHLLGIIDVRQGRGTYLRDTSSDVLLRVIDWGLALGQPRTLDLVEVRRILEVEAAGLAAERRSEADCDELATRLAAIEDAVNDASADRYVEADIAFHMQLARMAGNGVLTDMLQSVRSLLEVWIRRILAVEGVAEENYRFHSRVADAVIRGDAAAAATAMTEHMQSGEERLRSTLTLQQSNTLDDA